MAASKRFKPSRSADGCAENIRWPRRRPCWRALPSGGSGRIAEHPRLKAAYEQAIGHETSNSTVYNLWHGMAGRKLMPRPFHPKRDLAAQHDLKNRFPTRCKEGAAGAARRGRRLRIMFADEARFGRINRPRPCWAPRRIRPQVASQLIREYIYLYGAVSPKDGPASI